jgi:DNA-binding GntR family transcriptional regulator
VREALRELVQQGLVVSYPHGGAFIRTFTRKRVEDLVHLRAAVEGMAAWQAVEQASRAQLRRQEALVEALGGRPGAEGGAVRR